MPPTKTMEQDWEDTFPFLVENPGLEAPFLMMLQHATSRRHLTVMLEGNPRSEPKVESWLPPHWQLSLDERAAMRRFWWDRYNEYRKPSGVSDYLVRFGVSRACRRNNGLRSHYVEKIRSKWRTNGPLTGDIRGKGDLIVRKGEDSSVLYSAELCGGEFRMNVYRALHCPDIDTMNWWIMFWIVPSRLTEKIAYSLLQLPEYVPHCVESTCVGLMYKLDEVTLDALVLSSTGQRGPSSWTFVDDGFDEELQRQLTAMGIPATIRRLSTAS